MKLGPVLPMHVIICFIFAKVILKYWNLQTGKHPEMLYGNTYKFYTIEAEVIVTVVHVHNIASNHVFMKLDTRPL